VPCTSATPSSSSNAVTNVRSSVMSTPCGVYLWRQPAIEGNHVERAFRFVARDCPGAAFSISTTISRRLAKRTHHRVDEISRALSAPPTPRPGRWIDVLEVDWLCSLSIALDQRQRCAREADAPSRSSRRPSRTPFIVTVRSFSPRFHLHESSQVFSSYEIFS